MRTLLINLLLVVLSITSQHTAHSQDTQLFVINPFPLEITYHKTVNLVFEYPIRSVDKGSADLLARKAPGVENILQIKAARKDFIQTNLTVITTDGRLHSFVVDYTDLPNQLNIEVVTGRAPAAGHPATLVDGINQAELNTYIQHAASMPSAKRLAKDQSHSAKLLLTGIYIKQDVIYYRLKLINRSQVSYEPESIRFFISDKKTVKRSSSQQTEIKPYNAFENNVSVPSGQIQVLVFALPKFTLPDQKQLIIQVMEKNGGRHLKLTVKNRRIIRARTI
jgi:conjugative transposon TraN protein